MKNFRRVETFDGQVQHSIQLMDSEIFDIVKNEEQLQSKLTELQLDLQSYQTNRDYIVVKHQRLFGLEDMLKRSALANQMELLCLGGLHFIRMTVIFASARWKFMQKEEIM